MLSIRDIQGDSLRSPYAGKQVQTRGVVTGTVRRGCFIQTASKEWDGIGSDAVYVYSPDKSFQVGTEIEIVGECVDYLKDDSAKPITQIHLESARLMDSTPSVIRPIELTAEKLAQSNSDLAIYLNSLEGMLVSVPAGSTFVAPSNSFGDYVLALADQFSEADIVTSPERGVIVEASNPLRWFPGFRVTQYQYAKRLNVGSVLKTDIVGPLNYRVGSYQISVSNDFDFEPNFIELTKSSLKPSDGALTIMTLNCFNLDNHVESENNVMNPRKDVDDDWGEGRFHTLAQAVVLQANVPDIVALQEIQDNDGAEISDVTDASETYEMLIRTIEQLSGVRYSWIDVAPELGADGGQPGGNIRNGYLYNPARVELDSGSIRTLGSHKECYQASRKPLVCTFSEKSSGKRLAVINVHLASKRHQASIFAAVDPGVDAKLSVRTEQAEVIQQETDALDKLAVEYYVTGDFNDGEYSEPMKTLIGNESVNLVFELDEDQRYDYNHRGKLQVLMHGIVPIDMRDSGRAEYEIIHGNELIGIQPGAETDKPSDHAYVIAKLQLK